MRLDTLAGPALEMDTLTGPALEMDTLDHHTLTVAGAGARLSCSASTPGLEEPATRLHTSVQVTLSTCPSSAYLYLHVSNTCPSSAYLHISTLHVSNTCPLYRWT